MQERKLWTKNRIGGLVFVLWGGYAIVKRLAYGAPAIRSEAYAAGESAGFLTLVALAIVGLYYLIKG